MGLTQLNSAAIQNSTVDNTPIGQTTPALGQFNNVNCTGLNCQGSGGFSVQLTAPTVSSGDNSQQVATTAWSKLGFSISLATNGFFKFPTWLGGLMLQWGTTGTLTSNVVASINFPTAFPTSALAVVGNDSGPRVTSGNPQPVACAATSRFAFNVIIGGSGETVTWFAVGY